MPFHPAVAEWEEKARGSPAPERLVAAPDPHRWYGRTKRAMDVSIAALLIVATAPLVVAACVAIVLITRGNPIYTQTRVGLLGREFRMFKLRTMAACTQSADVYQPRGERPAVAPKDPQDPRITRVGRLLRRTSIDELPQLVNVLMGEMSLVGPRPGLPSEVALYRPSWHARLTVKPGITGIWQVSGRSTVEVHRWMAMDVDYVRRRSLACDLVLLLQTPRAVVSMRGAW